MAKTSAVRHARDGVGGQWVGEEWCGFLVGRAFRWEEVDGNTEGTKWQRDIHKGGFPSSNANSPPRLASAARLPASAAQRPAEAAPETTEAMPLEVSARLSRRILNEFKQSQTFHFSIPGGLESWPVAS